MHEYSIVAELIQRVEQEAVARGASRVTRVHVRIGEVSGVEVPLLATAYTTFRERTVCEDADLAVTTAPARWVCGRCGAPIAPGARLRCVDCGVPARLAEGDEIMLDRIEMEVPNVP
jgi:hydrogenase nickel incorporation protein HypA/HybF